MSNTTISVSIKPNTIKLVRAFSGSNLFSFFKKEVNRLAVSVTRFSKQLTPVDSGLLRARIDFTPVSNMLQSIVSTNSNYAIYVHQGTRYMRARPFMEQGATIAQTATEREFKGRLDEEFVKNFKTL